MIRCSIFCLLLAVCGATSYAAPAVLQQRLDRLVAPYAHTLRIGVEVVDCTSKASIYSYHAHQLFTPASCMKLCTAAAAFHYLGDDYTFSTSLVSTASIVQDVLQGDLYLCGSGDPMFTEADLQELVDQLTCKEITGHVYLDVTLFDTQAYSPYNTARKDVSWNGPVDALLFWPQLPIMYQGASTYLNGTFYQRIGVAPHRIVGDRLMAMLRDKGIQVHGDAVVKPCALLHANTLAQHSSKPLKFILTNIIKRSCNVEADCLFKKIAAHLHHVPASWSQAQKALHAWFKSIGVDVRECVVIDGSGRCHENKLSPHVMVTMLQWALKQSWRQAFLDTLPVAGYDGTLKKRMHALKRRVFAKTGSLDNVASLCGYIYKHGKPCCTFAIMINGFSPKYTRSYINTEIIDKLCTIMVNHYDH